MINPYGAVRQELESGRRTLRDLVGDFLESKVAESRMGLARAKLDVEREGLVIEGEKEKAKGLADVAKAQMDTRALEEGFRLKGLEVTESERSHKATEAETAAFHEGSLKNDATRNGLLLKQQQFAEEEKKYLREPLSAEQLGRELGITPGQMDAFVRRFPNGTTRENAKVVAKDMTDRPGAGFMFEAIGNIDNITHINDQLGDPNITPEQKAGLETQLGKETQKFNRNVMSVNLMQDGKNSITPENYAKFKEKTTELWEGMPADRKAAFGNSYETYESETMKGYKAAIRAGTEDFKTLLERGNAGKGKGAGDKNAEIKLTYSKKLDELEGLEPQLRQAGIDPDKAKKNAGKHIAAGNYQEADKIFNNAKDAVKKFEAKGAGPTALPFEVSEVEQPGGGLRVMVKGQGDAEFRRPTNDEAKMIQAADLPLLTQASMVGDLRTVGKKVGSVIEKTRTAGDVDLQEAGAEDSTARMRKLFGVRRY